MEKWKNKCVTRENLQRFFSLPALSLRIPFPSLNFSCFSSFRVQLIYNKKKYLFLAMFKTIYHFNIWKDLMFFSLFGKLVVNVILELDFTVDEFPLIISY